VQKATDNSASAWRGFPDCDVRSVHQRLQAIGFPPCWAIAPSDSTIHFSMRNCEGASLLFKIAGKTHRSIVADRSESPRSRQ